MAESPPWTDCPLCPACKCHTGIPSDAAANGAPADCSLFCSACGHGWNGTAAEVAQAEKAQAAWEIECGADDPHGELAKIAAGEGGPAPVDPKQLSLFGEAR